MELIRENILSISSIIQHNRKVLRLILIIYSLYTTNEYKVYFNLPIIEWTKQGWRRIHSNYYKQEQLYSTDDGEKTQLHYNKRKVPAKALYEID